MSSSNNKFRLNPDVVFQPMDDEAIIVSLDSEEIFKLNRTGAEIVRLIEADLSLSEILPRLAEQFEIDQTAIEAEVTHLLEQLIKAELVREENQ